MLKFAGPLLIVFGVIHFTMSFVLFSEPLTQVVLAGPFAGLYWSFAMLASFWFLVFTWPIMMLGIAIAATYRQFGYVPSARLIGIMLMVVPVVAGVFLPLSGVWAFIVPGGMLLFGSIRPRSRRRVGGRIVS